MEDIKQNQPKENIMARATYDDIAAAIFVKNSELPRNEQFLVLPPYEDGMALSVYPSLNYLPEYGVSVILNNDSAELTQDGASLGRFAVSDDVSKVAEAIVEAIGSKVSAGE